MDEQYKLFGNFEKILKFFDKNSLEKFNFYPFLERLLTIEPSEIPSFFYKNFFNFAEVGGKVPVFPHGGAYDMILEKRFFGNLEKNQHQDLLDSEWQKLSALGNLSGFY